MTAATKLTALRVEAIFRDCLFTEDEDTSDAVFCEGVVHNVGLHPGRLEAHRENITALLAELPDQFKRSGGGGWSFLNARLDRDGNQWASLHLTMEQLFQLGEGIGLVTIPFERKLWSALPDSVPYLVVEL